MAKREMKRKILLVMLLMVIVISGSALYSTLKINAAHSNGCNGTLYYQGVIVQNSTYTHNSQYGVCTVTVRETFNQYKCRCGAEQALSRINKHEIHNQPH